ncbi:phage tail sheath C-terminal domain-containing protein [Fusobacterium sp. IOR10]|uniref:phage tail sheath C-terminal domain-containing protein n=1 Tax=Fusobacterium sp. IOR10 TaxID=2665157 RepID=UPI0013D6E925|nr:phage tail sheath C-terminal domain-containing protein [Fusobacterium sp. IOR10]
MATQNGLPELEIIFKALGASAVKRGDRGTAVLIVVDDTSNGAGVVMDKIISIADLTTKMQDHYTESSIRYIKDALLGTPRELLVFKMATEGVLADTLKLVSGRIPRNCWVAIASQNKDHQNDLVSWGASQEKNNFKKYKILSYKAIVTDNQHIINLTNEKVVFSDSRGEQNGIEAVSYLMGYLAGLPLTMSAIAKDLTLFSSVSEIDDLNEAISNGEFILFNDEGKVKVARGVNSLKTLGEGISNDMSFINTIEKMDLIFCDIYSTWNKYYKGRYSNDLDNQMIFISAVNGYFKLVAIDKILDPKFDNRAVIDITAQRIANYSKFGEEVVKEWTDTKAMEMTVGTKIFLTTLIKIPGIMESILFPIFTV